MPFSPKKTNGSELKPPTGAITRQQTSSTTSAAFTIRYAGIRPPPISTLRTSHGWRRGLKRTSGPAADHPRLCADSIELAQAQPGGGTTPAGRRRQVARQPALRDGKPLLRRAEPGLETNRLAEVPRIADDVREPSVSAAPWERVRQPERAIAPRRSARAQPAGPTLRRRAAARPSRPQARSEYSRNSVWTMIASSWLMNGGTMMRTPLSRMAGL